MNSTASHRIYKKITIFFASNTTGRQRQQARTAKFTAAIKITIIYNYIKTGTTY